MAAGRTKKIENLHPELQAQINYAARTSKRLARGLFHAMARFGPKLDREQLLLSRFVGIATELFAMSATCSFAQSKIDQGAKQDEVLSWRIIFAGRPGCGSISIFPAPNGTRTSAATN